MSTLVAVEKGVDPFRVSPSKTHHESMLGGTDWLAGKKDLCRGCSRSGHETLSNDRDGPAIGGLPILER